MGLGLARRLAQRLLLPLWGGGFAVAFAQLCACYYLLGVLLHFVVPLLFPVRGIQEQPRKPGEVARDALHSLGPIAVKAGVWVAVEQLHARGYGRLYAGPLLPSGGAGGWQRDVAYLVVCVALLDVLHDAWFYWTHRLLHWRPLYKWVHWEHHRAVAPSAFTGYSFHVAEAALVFANEVLVCFLFPLHMGLHRVYHLATTAVHEAGHAGYEIAPFIPTVGGLASLAACGARGSAALNTVQHHDLHHRFPRGHFSLYFTHWDRACGTLHPGYDRGIFRYFEGDGKGGGGEDACGGGGRSFSGSFGGSARRPSGGSFGGSARRPSGGSGGGAREGEQAPTPVEQPQGSGGAVPAAGAEPAAAAVVGAAQGSCRARAAATAATAVAAVVRG